MKTLEQMKLYKSETLDGRDLTRLAAFLPADQLGHFGLSLKEGVTAEEWNKDVVPWTKENILKQLEKDVNFGFEKALNRRGLSAGMMHEVVKMWNYVLEEGLENFDDYAQYGLPLFKVTAIKYGFENPIGDDTGNEDRYASH